MDNLLSQAYTTARVDAVLSPYDGMSRGVISALKSAGYGNAAKPLPVVTGQDAELASVKSIIAGEQTQTVFKDTRELAKAAVQRPMRVLTGGTPEVNDTKTYDNGVKVVPVVPARSRSASTRRTTRTVLVDSGYYTGVATFSDPDTMTTLLEMRGHHQGIPGGSRRSPR